ncbi:hypothetical protein [Rappaport israeli]|uniref:hypothetical protein n=1 Tax=Rappaport israeli TaxID=1839807 RepID=UPI0038CD8661
MDEAATLPAQQLHTLTQHYPHFTLATSEDGYEGSARHFSLHTLPALQKQHPTLIITPLYNAQRHPENDPLEQLIEQTFFPQRPP